MSRSSLRPRRYSLLPAICLVLMACSDSVDAPQNTDITVGADSTGSDGSLVTGADVGETTAKDSTAKDSAVPDVGADSAQTNADATKPADAVANVDVGESADADATNKPVCQNGIKTYTNGAGVELNGISHVRKTVAGQFVDRSVVAGVRFDSTGNQDLHVAAHNGDGTLAWVKTMGGKGIDRANDAAYFEYEEHVVVVGSTDDTPKNVDNAWVLRFSFDGSLDWQLKWGGDVETVALGTHDSFYTYQQGVAVVGRTGAGKSAQGFLITVDPKGQVKWVKTMGGPERDELHDVLTGFQAITAVGGKGQADGTVRPWLVMFDSVGKLVFDVQIDSLNGPAYAVDHGANPALTHDFVAGGDDGKGAGWLGRFDKTGKPFWQRTVHFGRIRSLVRGGGGFAVIGRKSVGTSEQLPIMLFDIYTGVRLAGADDLPTVGAAIGAMREVEAIGLAGKGFRLVGRVATPQAQGTTKSVGLIGTVSIYGTADCSDKCGESIYNDCKDADPCTWHTCKAGKCNAEKMLPGEVCN